MNFGSSSFSLIWLYVAVITAGVTGIASFIFAVYAPTRNYIRKLIKRPDLISFIFGGSPFALSLICVIISALDDMGLELFTFGIVGIIVLFVMHFAPFLVWSYYVKNDDNKKMFRSAAIWGLFGVILTAFIVLLLFIFMRLW